MPRPQGPIVTLVPDSCDRSRDRCARSRLREGACRTSPFNVALIVEWERTPNYRRALVGRTCFGLSFAPGLPSSDVRGWAGGTVRGISCEAGEKRLPVA